MTTYVVQFRSRVFVVRDCEMCGEIERPLTHRTGENRTYYVDAGEQIKGRTISGVTSITSDDGAMTVGSLAILSTDTSDFDADGNTLTIEANTGMSFGMSGGTAGGGYEDYTATLTILFTTSAGTEEARVRVRVE